MKGALLDGSTHALPHRFRFFFISTSLALHFFIVHNLGEGKVFEIESGQTGLIPLLVVSLQLSVPKCFNFSAVSD